MTLNNCPEFSQCIGIADVFLHQQRKMRNEMLRQSSSVFFPDLFSIVVRYNLHVELSEEMKTKWRLQLTICVLEVSRWWERQRANQMVTPGLTARDSLKRVDKQGLLYSQMSAVFANILFIRPIAYCDGHSGSIRGKKWGAIHMAVGGWRLWVGSNFLFLFENHQIWRVKIFTVLFLLLRQRTT